MAEEQQLEDKVMSSSRLPILVILGATGSGKSRLGIELARKFAGEIISADSMQVYKGLDVITAKVTKEEQTLAKHHMLDVVDPLDAYTVIDYRNRALQIMENLVGEKKMPIIVGGTNYYIESLIWQTLVDDPKQEDAADSDEELICKKIRRIKGVSNEQLHKKLMEVDPEMATRLHPNNRRKIIRSLEIFERHGTTHTEILRQQRVAGGCGLGGPLRHKNSIILWLTCNKERKLRRTRTQWVSDSSQEADHSHLCKSCRYSFIRIATLQTTTGPKGLFIAKQDLLNIPRKYRKKILINS